LLSSFRNNQDNRAKKKLFGVLCVADKNKISPFQMRGAAGEAGRNVMAQRFVLCACAIIKLLVAWTEIYSAEWHKQHKKVEWKTNFLYCQGGWHFLSYIKQQA